MRRLAIHCVLPKCTTTIKKTRCLFNTSTTDKKADLFFVLVVMCKLILSTFVVFTMFRKKLVSSLFGLRLKSTAATPKQNIIGAASQNIFAKEQKYGAHNYQPLPVALQKGEGEHYYFNELTLYHMFHFIFVYCWQK